MVWLIQNNLLWQPWSLFMQRFEMANGTLMWGFTILTWLISISHPVSNSSPSVVGCFQPSKSGHHYPTRGSFVPGNLTFVKVNTGRRCMCSRSVNQGRCIWGLTSLACVYTPNGTCNTPLVLFLDQGILQLCYEHPPCNTPLVVFLHQRILQL